MQLGRKSAISCSNMKQFATVTVIGRDKTGVIARVTAFLFEQHANIEALEEQEMCIRDSASSQTT